jgi:D-serine dehydratase
MASARSDRCAPTPGVVTSGLPEDRLRAVEGRVLDHSVKGLALNGGDTVAASAVADREWNVLSGHLSLPVMVIKQAELEHNIGVMADYCVRHGVTLAPHGKTTMAPQLFDRQLRAGAWGITAATVSQARSFRGFGVSRILVANVLVDAEAIEWVIAETESDPDMEILFYVDSLAGVDIVECVAATLRPSRPLRVLLELGYENGRTGCRTAQEALAIASAAATCTYLELVGVAGFEGLIPGASVEEVVSRSHDFLEQMHALVVDLESKAAFGEGKVSPIVSAGGSSYFDLVIEHLSPRCFGFESTLILRSGCYITHDAEMYEETSALAGVRTAPGETELLVPALELWATVWSRPEPGLAIVGFGKRDAPYDYRLPVVQTLYRTGRPARDVRGLFHVESLNDQHAFLTIPPADDIAPGDRLTFGVSHPCGAFDKWDYLPIVDDTYTVIDGISTFF